MKPREGGTDIYFQVIFNIYSNHCPVPSFIDNELYLFLEV